MSDDPNQLALFTNRGRVASPGVLPAQRRVKPDLWPLGQTFSRQGRWRCRRSLLAAPPTDILRRRPSICIGAATMRCAWDATTPT